MQAHDPRRDRETDRRFGPQVRREVANKFKGLEIDTCPFANLPEKKRTQWALTKEDKELSGFGVNWWHKLSSPNGSRTVT